jgi:hypothetical protein
MLRALALAALIALKPATITIDLKNGTDRERQTKTLLEQLLDSFDLSLYTFTRHVVIEQRAINHAFPVLTLNARFADSPDELLSSYIHEQMHWHLRDHDRDQRDVVSELRRAYPNAPMGAPNGAENLYSTYEHLIDCYLEVQADRQLMGPERTAAVIADKGHYLWIYATVERDERRIGALVRAHHLQVK